MYDGKTFDLFLRTQSLHWLESPILVDIRPKVRLSRGIAAFALCGSEMVQNHTVVPKPGRRVMTRSRGSKEYHSETRAQPRSSKHINVGWFESHDIAKCWVANAHIRQV